MENTLVLKMSIIDRQLAMVRGRTTIDFRTFSTNMEEKKSLAYQHRWVSSLMSPSNQILTHPLGLATSITFGRNIQVSIGHGVPVR
jgi:hypothetical protein